LLKRMKLDGDAHKDHTFYRGKGCKNCGGTGYLGRVPIFEFLVIDQDIRELIVASANEMQIRAMARQKGYGGLFESGVYRMKQGLTTAEEVLSVTFAEDIG
jgi:type IV pilus assembly protein PilB